MAPTPTCRMPELVQIHHFKALPDHNHSRCHPNSKDQGDPATKGAVLSRGRDSSDPWAPRVRVGRAAAFPPSSWRDAWLSSRRRRERERCRRPQRHLAMTSTAHLHSDCAASPELAATVVDPSWFPPEFPSSLTPRGYPHGRAETETRATAEAQASREAERSGSTGGSPARCKRCIPRRKNERCRQPTGKLT